MDYVHRDTADALFFFFYILINTAKPETLIQMSIEKPGKKNHRVTLLGYCAMCGLTILLSME